MAEREPECDKKIRIAALMTCHNRRETTIKCLDAFYSQEELEKYATDVFLVDDGSADGTAEAVKSQFSHVKVISADGSLFWNRGMHLAFSQAITQGYDFYLWLNDDSLLDKDALIKLFSSYDAVRNEKGDGVIIGGAMRDPVTGKHAYGGITRWWGHLRQRLVEPAPDKPRQVEAVNGNYVLISAEVVQRVGNLDPVFQHRWGDYDYCFRALEKKCTVWLAPGYLGVCPRNPVTGTWEDVKLGFIERIKELRSKKSMDPQDHCVYLKRHRGSLWRIQFVLPYIKVAIGSLSSLFFKSKR